MKPWFKLCLTTAITNSTIDLAENGILKIWSGLVGTEIIFGVNIWVSGKIILYCVHQCQGLYVCASDSQTMFYTNNKIWNC